MYSLHTHTHTHTHTHKHTTGGQAEDYTYAGRYYLAHYCIQTFTAAFTPAERLGLLCIFHLFCNLIWSWGRRNENAEAEGTER